MMIARARYENLGNHQLIRGDCARVLKRLKSETVDVIITSPPYNIGLPYRNYRDNLSEGAYLDWMEKICRHLCRILRDDGSFFLNMTGSSKEPWLPFELMVRLRGFFELQNHISWVKSIAIGDVTYGHFKPVNSSRYVNRNHEHIFHLTKRGNVAIDRLSAGVPFTDKSNIARRQHSKDRRCRGDTWYIPYKTVHDRVEKYHHPATFPVELPENCLRLHGIRKEMVVLDPFMGTGTTLVAAEKFGLQGIGIETDINYMRATRDRLRHMIAEKG